MATRVPPFGKADFAKRAASFADRALPGFPMLWWTGGAACVLMIVTGGFGTAAMPIGQRSLFWALLIGWNLAKWQAWFAWAVRDGADWWRASLIGVVVINLPLPIEIVAALRLVGIEAVIAPGRTWIEAAAIGSVIFALVAVLRRRSAPARSVAPPAADGVLARARIDPVELAAIEAEDHYCRLHRRDGSTVLVHGRFADALADVAALEGLQTHRGAWVADAAVTGAERAGRQWRLALAGGKRMPVSARHLAAVRARGWLAKR